MFDSVLHVAGSFALLTAVFLPLERLFPGQAGQPFFRDGWRTDFAYLLGQYLLWLAPVVAILLYVHAHVSALPLGGVRETVAGLPYWAQFGLVILLCDVCTYWAHRFSHHNAFLWRFHRVHHTSTRLDWLAAHREHPVDNLYTRLVENLPAIVLGFPLWTLAGFAVFRGMWAIYIHSNVSLTPGPLKYLLGAPRLHHWHHEVDRGFEVNFANLNPLMDVLFGTYYDPGYLPERDRYGIEEPAPATFVGQMIDPVLPRASSSSSRRDREPRPQVEATEPVHVSP